MNIRPIAHGWHTSCSIEFMLENKNILGRAKELRLSDFGPAIRTLTLSTGFYANSLVGQVEVARAYNICKGTAPKPIEEKVAI